MPVDDNEYIDWELIEKSLNSKSKLTQDEDALLSKWLSESSKHRDFYTNAIKENEIDVVDGLNEKELNDIKTDFLRRIDKKSRKYVYRKMLLYAAAIILPVLLLLSICLYDRTPVKQNIAADFSPGISKAVLVLEDGKQINLGDSSSSIDIGYASIQSSHNQAIYSPKNQETEVAVVNCLIVPRGGEYSIVLSDGTKVWLNSESSLEFPDKFLGRTREVTIRGEAYFDVAKMENSEFFIKTDDFLVKVTGTTFNINSYSDCKYSNITVESGTVIVSTTDGNQNIIGVGQRLIVDKDTKSIDIQYVDPFVATAWKDGIFYFDKEPLENIIKSISRWYNVDIEIKSNELRQLRFVGKITRYDNASKVLEMLKDTEYLNYKIDGQKIIVY